MSSAFPPAPPPPEAYGPAPVDVGPPPPELKRVLILLFVNLGLSIALTIAVLIARHSIVEYQLDHRHITDPAKRAAQRTSYNGTLWSRIAVNIVVSVVYFFLVRALLRGRRWAYRRVIILGIAGIVGLLLIQTTPYPPWMRVEQLVQALVLAALLYLVTRPDVRAHFAKGLPGRDVRRFRKQ